MVMRASFRLPDIVVGYFLHFFVVLFRIVGQYSKIGNEIAECLPRSVYKAKQVLGEVKFQCHVCKNVFQYTNFQCIETSSVYHKSKQCSFKWFHYIHIQE